MTEEGLKDMMLYGERINIEYKEAQNELPKSFWETYSSFANTIGGRIVLGVKEHRTKTALEERFELQGVNNAAKILKSLWDTVNSDKVSRNILLEDNVETVDCNEKQLIVVAVPMANYTDRPIYINRNILGGTYKRNYEGDYHCTDDEVKSMLRDANENGNDGALLDFFTMDDIDLPTLHAYRNRFEVRNVDHVFNQLTDKEFLKNMGGYTIDRNTKHEGLTVAGLMMFGKGLPIRERFDNLRMDYIDQTNLVGESRWSDRLTYDGTWENNLFNFFTRVIQKLTADLKRPFKLEGMERIDDTPVHKAVREGLTNMIIHADLLITGVLKVVKRDNGILFSNPGSLKIPFEDIKRGGNSKARNPRIQNMLRMVGFGDNIGSGYPTILKAWKDQNWRCPTLLDRPELRQVDLTLPMISLLPEQTLHEMQHTLGEQEYARLSANEQTALAYVWNGEDVSNAVLQQLLSLNSIEAGRLLHNMVDKGLLNQDSKGRWTTYALQKTLFERLETDVKEKSEGKEKKMKEKSEGKEFSLQEKAVARYLKERNEATYKELAEAMKISEATIYRIIKKMRGKGILQRQAGRKNGKWAVWWDEENQ
jgi:ATP-dependent DNA helicase RecG